VGCNPCRYHGGTIEDLRASLGLALWHVPNVSPNPKSSSIKSSEARVPRTTTLPIVKLLLSPSQTAIACGVSAERVRDGINSGTLTVRKLGMKHRIAVFGDGGIQKWFESWPEVEKRKSS